MKKAFSILKRFAVFFSIPYLELVLLRLFISRETIYRDLDLVFSPGKIFYSIIPLTIAFIVFMILLEKQQTPLSFVFQKKAALINGMFWTFFLIFSRNLDPLVETFGKEALTLLWYGIGLIVFVSSFLVLLNFKELYEKIIRHPAEVYFSFFAGSLFLLFHLANRYLWSWLAAFITIVVYTLLNFVGFDMQPAESRHLHHPLFFASIDASCSGLEGIFLFIFLFSLILLVDWEKYTPKKAALIYLAGIVYMLFLNILRITIFFMGAVWASDIWGQSSASEVFIWLFHANIGWVFYVVGIVIFFALLLRQQRSQTLPRRVR